MRRYAKGLKVVSMDELMQREFIIVDYGTFQKVYNRGWFSSWQLRYADRLLKWGWIYDAIPQEVKPDG